MSCGVGRRCGLDLVLLWLWYRLAAIAPIWSLVWELPYATGEALKRKKKKKDNADNAHGSIPLSSTFWDCRELVEFFLKCLVAIPSELTWGLTIFFLSILFMAAPAACGSFQGWIRAAAASLCHNHGGTRSELHLRPTPQLVAMTDP